MLPTQSYLKECFDYESETGILKWKGRPMAHFKTGYDWEKFNNRNVRKIIKGYKTNFGDQRVKLDGKFLMLHRVIWKWVHGTEPKHVKRIDNNKLNNKLANLVGANVDVYGVCLLDGQWHVIKKCNKSITSMGAFTNAHDAQALCDYLR